MPKPTMRTQRTIRKPSVSAETKLYMFDKNIKDLGIISLFPITRPKTADFFETLSEKDRFSRLTPAQRMEQQERIGFITLPDEYKKGMKKYNILCKKCGEVIAFCWATGENMADWTDLHYISKTNGHFWRGCMAVNINPKRPNGPVGFECACGQDTRKPDAVGRAMGFDASSFYLVEVE